MVLVFGPPEAQQKWISALDGTVIAAVEERHPNWFDLLFDMVMVAHFRILGAVFLEHDLDDHVRALDGVLAYVTVSMPVLLLWANVGLYQNMFGTGNFWDILYYTLNMVGSLAVVVNVESCDSDVYGHDTADTDCRGYMWSLVATRALTSCMWLRCAYYGVGQQTYMYPIRDAFLFVLYLVAGYYQAFALIWTAVLAETTIFAAIQVKLQLEQPPIHIELMAERYGLLVIIALGEVFANTVKDAMANSWTAHQEATYLVTIGMSAILGFCIMWYYFFALDASGSDATVPALRRSRLSGHIFLYSHFPLVLAITLVAGWFEAYTVDESLKEDDGDDGGVEVKGDDEFAYTLKNTPESVNHMLLVAMITIHLILIVLRRCGKREHLKWDFSKHPIFSCMPEDVANLLHDAALYPVWAAIAALCAMIAWPTVYESSNKTLVASTIITASCLVAATLLMIWQHPRGANALDNSAMAGMGMEYRETLTRMSETAEAVELPPQFRATFTDGFRLDAPSMVQNNDVAQDYYRATGGIRPTSVGRPTALPRPASGRRGGDVHRGETQTVSLMNPAATSTSPPARQHHQQQQQQQQQQELQRRSDGLG